jgi:nitrous oxide reductase accessory protein NosL
MLWLGALLAGLAACARAPQSGPVEIAWDRDVCEYCRMVISDRAHAAQIRGGPGNKVYRFDDLGCALNWLQARGWDQQGVEIWVADSRHPRQVHWLDARAAHYLPGQTTPMDYGLGAVSGAPLGSLDFTAARRAMLERNRSR